MSHLRTAYELGVQLAFENAGMQKKAIGMGSLSGSTSGSTAPQSKTFTGAGIGSAFKNLGNAKSEPPSSFANPANRATQNIAYHENV